VNRKHNHVVTKNVIGIISENRSSWKIKWLPQKESFLTSENRDCLLQKCFSTCTSCRNF